ncbi:MAG: hypothetical protein KF788_06505 [Piscinibacter sp.]|nr:hypothetical protein [Piscinibacter sp.]
MRALGFAAAAVTVAVSFPLAGCERFQQKEPLPAYHDSKLDAMRSITGSTLPTSHESNAIRADADQRAAAGPPAPAEAASVPAAAR